MLVVSQIIYSMFNTQFNLFPHNNYTIKVTGTIKGTSLRWCSKYIGGMCAIIVAHATYM